ncbi:MAG: NAD-dependent epimerase/dehydratase family protein [Phycisphaerae bacterium]
MRSAIIGCGYVGCALAEALVRAGHDVVATTTTPERVAVIESINDRVLASGVDPCPGHTRPSPASPPGPVSGAPARGGGPAYGDPEGRHGMTTEASEGPAAARGKPRIAAHVLEHSRLGELRALLTDCTVVYLTLAPGGRGGDYRAVYLDGTRNLLRAVENTSIRQIIYTSSTQVYGQEDGSWVDEESPTKPRSVNGLALLAAEQALLEDPVGGQAVGPALVSTTVVRLGGIYGPGRDLGERIRAAAGTQRSDGDAYVNLIHRDDIVVALVRLIDVPYRGILNLVDDTPMKRRELYDRVMATAGLPGVRWIMGGVVQRSGKRVRNGLIKRTLGLTLQHPRAQ